MGTRTALTKASLRQNRPVICPRHDYPILNR
jgi:hypothetical protein